MNAKVYTRKQSKKIPKDVMVWMWTMQDRTLVGFIKFKKGTVQYFDFVTLTEPITNLGKDPLGKEVLAVLMERFNL